MAPPRPNLSHHSNHPLIQPLSPKPLNRVHSCEPPRWHRRRLQSYTHLQRITVMKNRD
ncbi:hypothetical protein SESBI_11239 [Sesbania bispinosa]|nr:hypothetical protein SESBI_11239 [Sesbania bispinosa]